MILPGRVTGASSLISPSEDFLGGGISPRSSFLASPRAADPPRRNVVISGKAAASRWINSSPTTTPILVVRSFDWKVTSRMRDRRRTSLLRCVRIVRGTLIDGLRITDEISVIGSSSQKSHHYSRWNLHQPILFGGCVGSYFPTSLTATSDDLPGTAFSTVVVRSS